MFELYSLPSLTNSSFFWLLADHLVQRYDVFLIFHNSSEENIQKTVMQMYLIFQNALNLIKIITTKFCAISKKKLFYLYIDFCFLLNISDSQNILLLWRSDFDGFRLRNRTTKVLYIFLHYSVSQTEVRKMKQKYTLLIE